MLKGLGKESLQNGNKHQSLLKTMVTLNGAWNEVSGVIAVYTLGKPLILF